MDIAGERRVIQLFEEALDWPAGDRLPRLQALLTGEPDVLAAVLAMLKADQSSALLPTLPPEPMALDVGDAPERIGQYRIIEEIGRGGMGLVYRAARDDGLFDQQVAIKLIRGTIFSATTLEQFANERRILARLHHPHIALLLDGGVDRSGASYIIMELIHGLPITEHAEAHGLGLNARLDLFGQACSAIEYAHRALVVHADVKPSNVVVAEGFGVKLLDFGIARLVGEDGGAASTAHTPGYSSPARLAGERSTPTDDIFALGILLKALIEPVSGVDADLAAVADKAAEPDATRRYGAVSELVDDLDRWRRHKPVSARPPDRKRALSLLWRRNRVLLSFATAAAVLLMATAAITTVLYLRANRERAAAEQRFAEVRSLSDFLLSDAVTGLEAMPGSGPLRQRIADRAQKALDKLRQVPGAPLAVEAETANAYARVGEILAAPDLREVSDPAKGDAVLAQAEAMLRRLSAQLPAQTDLRVSLARTLVSRAVFQGTAKIDKAQAFKKLDEAHALLDPLLASGVGGFEARLLLVEADILRGYVHADALDYPASRAALEGALKRTAAIRPVTQRQRVDLAMARERALTQIGDARWYTGDQKGALQSYQQAMAEYDVPGLGTDIRITKRQAYGNYTVASSLFELGRQAEGLALSERGIAMVERMRLFDDSAGARRMGNIVREEYFLELRALGRFPEAIKQAEIVLAEFRAIAKLQPNNYQAQRSLPVDLLVVGDLYKDAGQTAKACAYYREGVTIWAQLAKTGQVAAFDMDNDVARIKAKARACG